MPYETYAFLRSLVEQRQELLTERFRSACDFIPTETPKNGVRSGIDKAAEIFRKENALMNQAKEDLHKAAQATYKDHPNPDMKRFWCFQLCDGCNRELTPLTPCKVFMGYLKDSWGDRGEVYENWKSYNFCGKCLKKAVKKHGNKLKHEPQRDTKTQT